MRIKTLLATLVLALTGFSQAADSPVVIDTPLAPPTWALLERELLARNAEACREYFAKYFDERGFLLCVERWGGDDGPDDAIENCNDWPILHALGGHDDVLKMYKKAWEGHLRQFTLAKTTDVPFARDGMYYKEFPVMFDWLHNGEGLTVFNLQGLGDPADARFQARVRRFAGFYLNEDPQAPNYDPQHKLIRSLFNGSRGPLMRKATAVDWAGDPIEVKGRFLPRHGEESYAQMLEHFEEYNDIVGDHPQNLLATSLAFNAYALTGDEKYKRWLLEYVDAWVARAKANGGILPSNIGLDGTIGGETGGKWYGGVYGWGFTVKVPQSPGEVSHRSTVRLSFIGFLNAYALTGDRKYLDVWRTQYATLAAQKKMIDGKPAYPHMFGDQGWYDYKPEPYRYGMDEVAFLGLDPADRPALASRQWYDYLEGQRPDYPEHMLRNDLERIRSRVVEMRNDPTTPDTRLSDDPMHINPASVSSLITLALAGVHPGHIGSPLHCRLRYFDPHARRAGFPPDVAALVEKLTPESLTVKLVNLSLTETRPVILQAGGYGEYEFTSVESNGQRRDLSSRRLDVALAPGCGATLTLGYRRSTLPPTLRFPWER